MDALTINRLKDVEKFARDQSESPYNNSRKERHVKELFAEIANRIGGIIEKEMSYVAQDDGRTNAWPFAVMPGAQKDQGLGSVTSGSLMPTYVGDPTAEQMQKAYAGVTSATWLPLHAGDPLPQAVMPLVAVQEMLKALEARIRALEPNKELQQAFKDEVKK